MTKLTRISYSRGHHGFRADDGTVYFIKKDERNDDDNWRAPLWYVTIEVNRELYIDERVPDGYFSTLREAIAATEQHHEKRKGPQISRCKLP